MEQATAYKKLQGCLKDIFAFSISKVYDKQDAEDLTQDIITEVLASVDRLENDSAFYGYMWRIAENVFKQYIRKKTPKINLMKSFAVYARETPNRKVLKMKLPF
ncbi:MAG: RNA polymerase sigma factor [Oscillospiraceae bacterium]